MRASSPTAMALAGLLAGLLLLAPGCGGSGSPQTTTSPLRKAEARAEAEAPKGASPLLREIYRGFPPPRADPKVKGSGKTIKAGERACKGKTPLQVKEEFLAKSRLLPEQHRMVARLAQFESSSAKSPDFPAGQLAALVYEGTLSKKALASYGYRGCIYSLVRRLEHQLAPR